jgi:uncharacterized protein
MADPSMPNWAPVSRGWRTGMVIAQSCQLPVAFERAEQRSRRMMTWPTRAATPQQQFLVVHGWQNRRPTGHWQQWLVSRLSARGHRVRYPQLPGPDWPVLKEWLAVLEEQLDGGNSSNLTVICHSLGCISWLHLADQGSIQLPVRRVLFVAPPGPAFLAAEPALTEFQAPAMKTASLGSLTRPRLVCADNDPYCPERADLIYGERFDIDLIDGQGHFDLPAGYGRWESLLNWCEDPTQRITSQ